MLAGKTVFGEKIQRISSSISYSFVIVKPDLFVIYFLLVIEREKAGCETNTTKEV